MAKRVVGWLRGLFGGGAGAGAGWKFDLGRGAVLDVRVEDGVLPLEVEAMGARGPGRYVLVAWAIGKAGEARRAYYEWVDGAEYGGKSVVGLSWYGAAAA